MRVYKDSNAINYQFSRYWCQKKAYLTFTGELLIDLKTQQSLPDKTLWDQTYKELQKIQPGILFDRGKEKIRAEFFVGGYAYTYDNHTRENIASVTIGALTKIVKVFGDRYWVKSGPFSSQSPAMPFKQIALSWQNSFGGVDFALNKQGKGLVADAQQLWPLPNIECPDNLLRQAYQQPNPVGFLPLSSTEKAKLKLLGTFNDAWLKEAWPYLPNDHDPLYWNFAPANQQQPNFWVGNEQISCSSMHPTKAVQYYTLADHKLRCFYQYKGEAPQEMMLNFDTIWFFPHLEQALLIWHGTIPIQDETAFDVEGFWLAEENRQTGTLAAAYYCSLLRDKIVRKPPPLVAPEPVIVPVEPVPVSPEVAKILADAEKMHSTVANRIGAARAMAEKALSDTVAKLPAEYQALFHAAQAAPPLPRIYDRNLSSAENKANIFKLIEEMLPLQALEQVRSALKAVPTPPDFDAFTAKVMGMLAKHPHRKDYAEQFAMIENGLQRAKAQYELSVERQKRVVVPPLTLDEKIAKAFREKRFEHLLIFDHDFDGFLFDEMVFIGTTFKQCRFNDCEFKNTDANNLYFDDCQLNQVEFYGGQFSGLTLNKITLENSYFSACQIDTLLCTESQWNQVVFDKVDFKQSIWRNTKWLACRFSGCQEDNTTLNDCTQSRIVWQDCQWKNVHYANATCAQIELTSVKLQTVSFVDSAITECSITDCQAAALNFTHCQMNQVSLKQASMPLIRFKYCSLKDWQVLDSQLPKFSCQDSTLINIEIQQSDLNKSRFHRLSIAKNISFLNVDLQKSSFTATELKQVCIERSDLTKSVWDRCQVNNSTFKANSANFSRFNDCIFSHALLTNSNYLNASFKRATFNQSEISSCNLVRVSFYHTSSDNLVIKGCLLPDPLPTGFWERWREVKHD